MRIDRALLGAALLLAASPTVAAPLEPQACATLKTEYDGLVAGGAKTDMDRGPEWAKTNLSPERLGKIERMIAVEEQLSFRCGDQLTARPVIKELPKPEPDTKPGDTTPGDKEQAGLAQGKATPSNIPPPKRKDEDAAKAASAKKDVSKE